MEEIVERVRPTYDKSTKPYELLWRQYEWNKDTRKLVYDSKWRHFSYYKSEQGVNDAIKAHRMRGKDVYPDEWRDKFKIKPYIRIYRYKAVKRKLI